MKALLTGLAAAILLAAGGREGTLLRRAAARAAALRNPLEADAAALQAGAKLYARECAACHGPDLAGGRKAPSLNRPEVRQASPGTLFWILRNGSLRTGMPSFAHLPEAQRWQIAAFLRQ